MFAPASLPHHYDPLQYCWYSIVKDMKEIPLNLIDFHNSEQLQQLKLITDILRWWWWYCLLQVIPN